MRGEQTITHNDGTETRLLFTNRALGEAETAMKRPVLDVLQALTDNKAGVVEIACLLQTGMEAARRDSRQGGKPVTVNDAYLVMDDVGFGSVVKAVAEGIVAVLIPSEPEKN